MPGWRCFQAKANQSPRRAERPTAPSGGRELVFANRVACGKSFGLAHRWAGVRPGRRPSSLRGGRLGRHMMGPEVGRRIDLGAGVLSLLTAGSDDELDEVTGPCVLPDASGGGSLLICLLSPLQHRCPRPLGRSPRDGRRPRRYPFRSGAGSSPDGGQRRQERGGCCQTDANSSQFPQVRRTSARAELPPLSERGGPCGLVGIAA